MEVGAVVVLQAAVVVVMQPRQLILQRNDRLFDSAVRGAAVALLLLWRQIADGHAELVGDATREAVVVTATIVLATVLHHVMTDTEAAVEAAALVAVHLVLHGVGGVGR